MMKKKNTYDKCIPLELLKKMRAEQSDGSFYNNCVKSGIIKKSISREEFLDYVLSYRPRGRHNSKEFVHVGGVIDRMLAWTEKQMQESALPVGEIDTITEVEDQITFVDTIFLWGDTKQIYKIDPSFMAELASTTNLKIPSSSLEYFPLKTFYIDFSESDFLEPMIGSFVHIYNGEKATPQISIIMLSKDEVMFSYYSHLKYGEDGTAKIPKEAVPTTPFVAFDVSGRNPQTKDYKNDPRAAIVRAIFQIIMFLSSSNSDILENPSSKKYHRAFTEPKDRFSEIRTWDVGVRYGKAIQISKSADKKGKENSLDEDREDDKPCKQRKETRPHLRCAHWQRYHVGKGRKEIKVNWIHPIIVGTAGDIPAVIKNVNL